MKISKVLAFGQIVRMNFIHHEGKDVHTASGTQTFMHECSLAKLYSYVADANDCITSSLEF